MSNYSEKIGICINKPFEIRLYSDRGCDTIICERHVSTCHWNGITQYGRQEWTYTARIYKKDSNGKTVEKVYKKEFSKKHQVLDHITKQYPNLFSIAISKL